MLDDSSASVIQYLIEGKVIESRQNESYANEVISMTQGLAETASTITVMGPEDHRIEGTEEEIEKKLKRLTSSIGRPLPDVEHQVRIPGGTPSRLTPVLTRKDP